MWRTAVFWLWLVLITSVVLIFGPRADDLAASSSRNNVFDATLSAALQKALEEAAREQGADSLSASLYISDQCFWAGATGFTEQDPQVPVDPDMLYGFGSITKTFVAALVFQLVEEKRLKLEDSLVRWLERIPNVDSSITVRQLLDHTSGLGDYLKSDRLYSAIVTEPDRVWSPYELVRYIPPPDNPPGKGTRYSNTNYLLLGMIIEAVSDNSVDQELNSRITGPLGLTNTSLPKSDFELHHWANDRVPTNSLYSAIWAAGAVASTPDDIAKWAHRLFSGGFLKSASLEQILVFRDKKIGRGSVPMGMGVWNFSNGEMVAWGHGGKLDPFLARMLYLPDHKLSIAYASSGGGGQGIPGKHLLRAYLANKPDKISMCFEPPN